MKKLAIASAIAITLSSAAFAAQPGSTDPYFSVSGVYTSAGVFGAGLGVTMPSVLRAGVTVGFGQTKVGTTHTTIYNGKDSQMTTNLGVYAGYPMHIANNFSLTLGAAGDFIFQNNLGTGEKAPMTYGAYLSLAYQLSPAAHIFVACLPYARTTLTTTTALGGKVTQNSVFTDGSIGLAWDIH